MNRGFNSEPKVLAETPTETDISEIQTYIERDTLSHTETQGANANFKDSDDDSEIRIHTQIPKLNLRLEANRNFSSSALTQV